MRIVSPSYFSLLLLAVAALCCGCRSVRQPFDYLFSTKYDQRYGNAAQFAREEERAADSREAFASYQDGGHDGLENQSLSIGDFAPKNLGDTYKKLTGRGPSQRAAEKLYQEAERQYGQLVYQANYANEPLSKYKDELEEAAEKYLDAAERWPESTLEEDSLFKAGECYFFANRYVDANETYERLIKKHPNSRYLDRVEAMRFSVAMYWLKIDDRDPQSFWETNFFDDERPMRGTFGHAVRILDRIRIDDPTGRLADDATLAAGNAHFQRGHYEQASDFYDDLIRTFPSSQHQFHAHYRGMIAKLESYRGPDYDGKALDEADELLKKIRKQFPHEADQHRDDLMKAAGIIRHEKARRNWTLANYYDRRGHNRAARMHYNDIVRDYDDTAFAERAQERLAGLDGEADEPPQRLSWLVNLFPDKNADTLVAPAATMQR